MVAKAVKRRYVCSACGASSPKWAGQCGDCQAWNTLAEAAAPRADTIGARRRGFAGAADSTIQALGGIERSREARSATGITELDRVLGGGVVAGSAVLIGGDPGIGKSTLLLQALAAMAANGKVLYVSGEESPQQIALRAERLDVGQVAIDVLAETSVERLIEQSQHHAPQVLVVDSVQTLFTDALSSAPGSVGQVRESAAQLVQYAKASGVTVLLVGHVTKEGTLAGPRVLEHMVDTVLYFDGDPGGRYRVLRAVKNRFGAVNEIGIFAMTEQGLRGVSNPSAIFLSAHENDAPGSVVMVTREGTRPLLVEVQALVDDSRGGQPRRIAVGLDQARLAMLLAVLHRHAGVGIADQDVFLNVVGGVRVVETAADLPVLLAVASSLRGRALPQGLVVFGEVGLTGEVRPVPNGEERLHEAIKHGFKTAIVPQANAPKRPPRACTVHAVANLSDALAVLASF